jgi:hypothetical protein
MRIILLSTCKIGSEDQGISNMFENEMWFVKDYVTIVGGIDKNGDKIERIMCLNPIIADEIIRERGIIGCKFERPIDLFKLEE